MNYRTCLKIGNDEVDGNLCIDGYEYEIDFEYNELVFESKTFSQGEGSLKFKMFSGETVYSLVLELEDEGVYSGEFREIIREKGMPEKVLQLEEVILKLI